ncbi:MAG: hypothetical protein HY330_05290 [Chloroflexi bacterium]|nr:hypothetical protein [Chloroflexota bacterium]
MLVGALGLLGCSNKPPAQPLASATTVTPAPPSGSKDVPSIGAGPATAPVKDVPSIGAGPATAPTPTPIPLKLLKIEPVKGYVGDPFTVTAEGLSPGRDVELVWVTVDGGYVTKASAENVEFYEKQFTEKRVSLGRARVDATGKLTVPFKAPEDYGEVHDIYAVVDGQDVARGGYRIQRQATITPEAGPLGTPITIKITGLGWKTYESTVALRYDNQWAGIISAVTTRGTATAVIRATGRTGKHVIDLNHGGRSMPFLNNAQSGTAHIPDLQAWFTVTDDKTMPPFALDWPDSTRLAQSSGAAPRTTAVASAAAIAAPSLAASVDPASGPILSRPTLRLRGLAPSAEVEAFWVTARGNRVSLSGWSLSETSILKTVTDRDGSLSATIQVPDDLGGWHVVKVVQGGKVVVEVPYFVERSVVGVTPLRVKAGETFKVQIKGIGWTELDNGVAITYDNSYIGFACGFNSNGDVTVNLVATGGPGIHLIDLYPMIYQGHGKPPWSYQVPLLSFRDDAPGLALGYKLPAIRLAVEIVE